MAIAPSRLGLMSPLLLGRQRRGRFNTQRRCGMKRPLAAQSTGSGATWSTDSGSAHDGLSRPDRAAIDGLAGHRGRTTRRHSRTGWRRLRLTWCGPGGLLQPSQDVGAWRHYGAGCGLAGQVRTSRRLRAKRHGWRRRSGGCRRRRFCRRCCNSRYGRHGRTRSGRRWRRCRCR